MNKVTLPDPLDLGVDDKLSDDQLSMVDAEKALDWDAPKDKEEPKKEPEAKEGEPKEEPKEEPKGEKEDEETPEEKEARETTEAEAKVETERVEKKAKELDKTVEEVAQIEADEKTEGKRLETEAKEEGITVEELKEKETAYKSLAERHGNDPIKIARALNKEQSEYGKLKGEVEELRTFKSQAEADQKTFKEDRFNAQMEDRRETVIEKYRDKFPKDEELSDDAVFEKAKGMILRSIENKEKEHIRDIKDKAESRREEIAKGISEEFKEFSSEIKTLLTDCGDRQVLDKDFDVEYLANYVRGKKFTPDYVKSLEEIAYNRGLEKPKMIPKVPAVKSKGGKKDSVDYSGITASEKSRAEEIYGRREGWTKERMWEEYVKSDKGHDF